MESPRRKPLLIAISLVVLVPFWWSGLSGQGASWLPWPVRPLWSFSHLFTSAQPSWRSHHVQLLGSDGIWHEVEHAPPFEHALFGHQTRLDWLLVWLDREATHPADVERRQRVLTHLCDSYAALYAPGEPATARLRPEALPIQRVRLVTFWRQSFISRPPPEPYRRSLPGPLLPENHVVLAVCSPPDTAEAP